MIVDVIGSTDRFNLSVVGADFINDHCYGEDFSNWLVDSLTASGARADVICMEDFGWANTAELGGVSYLVCVGGFSEDDASRPNYGEWRVMIERRRTLADKLFGRNKISLQDPLVEKVADILKAGKFADICVSTRA